MSEDSDSDGAESPISRSRMPGRGLIKNDGTNLYTAARVGKKKTVACLEEEV